MPGCTARIGILASDQTHDHAGLRDGSATGSMPDAYYPGTSRPCWRRRRNLFDAQPLTIDGRLALVEDEHIILPVTDLVKTIVPTGQGLSRLSQVEGGSRLAPAVTCRDSD